MLMHAKKKTIDSLIKRAIKKKNLKQYELFYSNANNYNEND